MSKIYKVTNAEASNIMILINKHQKLCESDAVYNLQYLDKRTQKRLMKLITQDTRKFLSELLVLQLRYNNRFHAVQRMIQIAKKELNMI